MADILPYSPDDALSSKSLPKVRRISFGDGYSQRSEKGINSNLKEWEVAYNDKSDATITALEVFFETHKGVTAFLWTPPGKPQGKYLCRSWGRVYSYGVAVQSLTATFEEVVE